MHDFPIDRTPSKTHSKNIRNFKILHHEYNLQGTSNALNNFNNMHEVDHVLSLDDCAKFDQIWRNPIRHKTMKDGWTHGKAIVMSKDLQAEVNKQSFRGKIINKCHLYKFS